MILPNFVGLGAQRAATTWIYQCLRCHPDVFIPDKKELAFFNWNFDKGVDWYTAQFAGYSGQKAIGEITPGYLNSEPAIRRIAEMIPDARFFVVLREPVQRAYSAYQLLQERYPGTSFRDACTESSYLVKESLYAEGIERIFGLFHRENVKVFLYDDVQKDPAGVIADLFHFLGVDADYRPSSMGKIYNRAMFSKVQDIVARLGLGWSLGLIKKTPIGDMIKRYHRSRGVGTVDPGASCSDAVRAKFCDDVIKLEALLGRDLSGWLERLGRSGSREVGTSTAIRSAR